MDTVQALRFEDSQHTHFGMRGEVTFLQLLEQVLIPSIWHVMGSDELQSVVSFLLPATPMGEVQANWLHQSGSIHVNINHYRAWCVASGDNKGTMEDDGIMNSGLHFQSSWGNLQCGVTTSQSEGPSTRANMELLDPSSQVTELLQKNFIW